MIGEPGADALPAAIVVSSGGPRRPSSDWRRLAWLPGTLLVILVAVAALSELVDLLLSERTTSVGALGSLGRLTLALGLVAGTAAVAVAALVAHGARSDLVVASVVLAIAASLRLVTVAMVPSPMESDWANYHRLAIEIAQRGPFFTSVATGWPMLLAIPYAFLGPDPWFGQLLNVVAGTVTTGLVFVVTNWQFGRRVAAIAATLFAVFPSHLLMTAVLGADTVFTTVVMAAIVAAVGALRSPRSGSWLVVGVLLGLAQYIRPASLIIVAGLVLLPWLVERRASRARAVTLLAVAFIVVLIPVIVWNRVDNGLWSLSTSTQGNWNLLVGLNREHDGSFNLDDEELVGGQRGTLEFDARAGLLARERLLADPVGTVALAIRKFPLFWGSEQYGAYWALLRANPDSKPALALLDLSQIAWGLVTATAAATLVGTRKLMPPLGWALLTILSASAAAFTLLEIQPRYHAYLVPLFCSLAAPALAAALGRGPQLDGLFRARPASPG